MKHPKAREGGSRKQRQARGREEPRARRVHKKAEDARELSFGRHNLIQADLNCERDISRKKILLISGKSSFNLK